MDYINIARCIRIRTINNDRHQAFSGDHANEGGDPFRPATSSGALSVIDDYVLRSRVVAQRENARRVSYRLERRLRVYGDEAFVADLNPLTPTVAIWAQL